MERLNIRTDLAIERLELNREILPHGVEKQETVDKGVRITRVSITDPSSARTLGRNTGVYITMEPADFQLPPLDFELEVNATARQLRTLIPEGVQSVLVVGLGNAAITPDALGPRAVQYLLVTRHFHGQKASGLERLCAVSAIAPGVLGQTGVESAQIIQALCREISPDAVIAIDALASRSMDRLGRTLQISDGGISPGSGVLNQRKELSRQTLGLPVISIGVPTVVDLATAVSGYLGHTVPPSEYVENLFITPRSIDLLIEHAAKTAAYSINLALHPTLSLQEITALVS